MEEEDQEDDLEPVHCMDPDTVEMGIFMINKKSWEQARGNNGRWQPGGKGKGKTGGGKGTGKGSGKGPRSCWRCGCDKHLQRDCKAEYHTVTGAKIVVVTRPQAPHLKKNFGNLEGDSGGEVDAELQSLWEINCIQEKHHTKVQNMFEKLGEAEDDEDNDDDEGKDKGEDEEEDEMEELCVTEVVDPWTEKTTLGRGEGPLRRSGSSRRGVRGR